jgi:hypothetical protein
VRLARAEEKRERPAVTLSQEAGTTTPNRGKISTGNNNLLTQLLEA